MREHIFRLNEAGAEDINRITSTTERQESVSDLSTEDAGEIQIGSRHKLSARMPVSE